jgi:predicted phage terminase large subunit-like protein
VQRVSPFYEFYPFHRHLSLELSRFLSAVEREESPRLLLTVPPRHGKSELCSIHFPAWVLGEHPDWSMIHTSYTADLSNGFSRKVRNMLKGEEYQRIYPGVKVSYDSRSVGYWNLEEPYRGTFVSTGVGGPITGRGGKVVLIDDPVKNREDADSEVFRASQRDWYTSTLYTRLEKGAGIILVQTRWHTDDLAGYVTTGAGTDDKPVDAARWRIVNLPAVCESASDPLGRAIGDPLWPEKYDAEALANIEGTLPLRDWLALYQQRPVAAEGNLLHAGKMHDTRRVPQRLYILQGWDFAISEKSSADWTVGVTIGLDPQNLDFYWLDMVRGRWDFNTALAQINAQAVKWKPVAIGLEDVALQAAWLQESRRRYLHPFVGLKSQRDKVTRAMPLADRIDGGKFYVDKQAEWFKDAEEELLAFPQGSKDDIVDALSKTIEAFVHMKQWRVA